MRYRKPKRTSKYWVEPEIFDNVVTFCRCYPVWLKELQTLPDPSRAIRYDGDKVQSTGGYDSTAELAMRRLEIERKVNLIVTTAQAASPDLWQWIIKGTTSKDYTIQDLIKQGMPAGKDYYGKAKAKFYYLISKRI